MKKYNTIIIGSGCAGYSAAERLYGLGIKDIALLTEGKNMGTSRNTGSDKQTYYKLSLCGAEGDSVREMAQTLYAGGGVMGEHALCEAAYSVRCFLHLVELGVPFPTNEYGEYAGYKTDHDPRSRATSSGPLTSKYMTEALERAVTERGIEIIDNMLAIEILTQNGRVTGVAAVSVKTGALTLYAAQNVILATGGPACIYQNTVYPESQHGATGLAVKAGATLSNLEEWQYGIASTDFRWNLSGTYQQVLPRYVSVDADGIEREFLYDALGEGALDLIFLKGYEWPFDTRKLAGSSQVDILVAEEIKKGRRVYLDFMHDPKGLEKGFSSLSSVTYDYLSRSGALMKTPIARLAQMNAGAIALYADHGIDLSKEYLAITVAAQHCNGGVMVDADWQSDVAGLYVVGEAAGTFGVYRPGGSALNSTQVGALRAAEHIARKEQNENLPLPTYTLPTIMRGASSTRTLRKELTAEMSRVADFDRSTEGMKALFARVSLLADNFFDTVKIERVEETAEIFRLYDTVLSMRAVLSAMLLSAKEIGSHGSALIDRTQPKSTDVRKTRTLTECDRSYLAPVSPMPEPELWFETLLARKRAEMLTKGENTNGKA